MPRKRLGRKEPRTGEFDEVEVLGLGDEAAAELEFWLLMVMSFQFWALDLSIGRSGRSPLPGAP